MKKVLLSIALILISTALLVKVAYITRGYFAVGGEWLLWTFPLLIIAARYGDGKEVQSSDISSKTSNGKAQEEKTEWI